MNIIETDGLTREFGDQLAVNDIDLRVPVGSVYGFLGPNGAGKTTTIRLLLGLIHPTAGKISLLSSNLHEDRHLLSRVGAMVEGPSLYPNLTGYENLEVTRLLLGISKTSIDEVLHIVQLSSAAHKLVSGYSLGMKQRLGIALALLSKPDLLVLDEPTNGLDPSGIREIRNLLSDFPNRYGITVFLSSHMLSEVEQIATHIGIIHQGKLIFQNTLGTLQEKRRERIRVGVLSPESAINILKNSGYGVQHGENGFLYIDSQGRDQSANINQLLVQENQVVFHLDIEKPALEDIFLDLTEEINKSYDANSSITS